MKNISLYLMSLSVDGESCKRVCFVPFLLIHLFKGVGDVKRTDLLIILKFEKFIPAMPSHIDKDIRSVVRQKTLGTWD